MSKQKSTNPRGYTRIKWCNCHRRIVGRSPKRLSDYPLYVHISDDRGAHRNLSIRTNFKACMRRRTREHVRRPSKVAMVWSLRSVSLSGIGARDTLTRGDTVRRYLVIGWLEKSRWIWFRYRKWDLWRFDG